MKKNLLRKLFALSLAMALLLCSLTTLIACGGTTEETPDDSTVQTPPNQEEPSFLDKIIKPSFKEYDRATVNFSEIEYARPNIENLSSIFAEIAELIKEGETDSADIISRLESTETLYDSVLTMQSIAMIFTYQDSSSSFWANEYEYISTNYPSLYQKIEDVMVAAAQSSDAEYYENNYFGKGLIDEYADGGDFTDAVVSLLEEEASLVSDYTSLSTATVEITYQQQKGTYDSFMELIKLTYTEGSAEYKSRASHLWNLYRATYSTIAIPIYTDLIKVRINLAKELGYDSYLDYAYENLGRKYSPDDMSQLLDGIVEYAVPVMTSQDLQYYAMVGSSGNQQLSLDKLMNNTYYILEQTDSELFDIYRYMLQFSLFNVDYQNANRYGGAFTTYIENYEAPYLFLTGEGYITDYLTLFHEFGHFCDYYLNGSSGSSLDLMEIYSQGFEFLITAKSAKIISETYATYLSNKAVYNALGILIDQGFYSRFEQLIYALDASEVTSAKLEEVLNVCAKEFGYITDSEYDGGSYLSLSSVMMVNHLFVSPGYVPSYCTSIISSLELYYMEIEEEGSGLEAYKHLLALGGKGLDIEEAVQQIGLSSPFDKEHLKELTNKIHYHFSGSNYWQTDDTQSNVA